MVSRMPTPEAMYESLLFFAAWAAFWGALSTACFLKFGRPRKDSEYGARIVSFVHGCLSTAMLLAALVSRSFCCLEDPTWTLDYVVLNCSLAYFAVDTVAMFAFGYFNWLFLGHHIMSISGVLMIMIDDAGFELTCIVLMLEISNPFLHSRWLYANTWPKYSKKSKMFRFLTWGFFAVFGFSRCVVGPVCAFYCVTSNVLPPVAVVHVVALQGFSVSSLVGFVKKQRAGEHWE
jgi:hypothetical protein